MKLNAAKNKVLFALLGVLLVAGLVTGLLVYSCQSDGGANSRVIAVSIQPQRYLLEQLTAGHFDVVCLLQDDANPESYEPAMNNIMALEQCRAYFMIGHIGFEAAILSKLSASRPDLDVIDTSAGVRLVPDNSASGEPDPHVWTSLSNAKIIANNMHRALIDLDAPHRSDYDRCYARLTARLDSIDAAMRTQFAVSSDTAFVVWHPWLTYLAYDYGLHQIAVEDENTPATPARVQHVVGQAREMNVGIVFSHRDVDGRTAQLAHDINARLVDINPMAHDWYQQLPTLFQ